MRVSESECDRRRGSEGSRTSKSAKVHNFHNIMGGDIVCFTVSSMLHVCLFTISCAVLRVPEYFCFRDVCYLRSSCRFLGLSSGCSQVHEYDDGYAVVSWFKPEDTQAVRARQGSQSRVVESRYVHHMSNVCVDTAQLLEHSITYDA